MPNCSLCSVGGFLLAAGFLAAVSSCLTYSIHYTSAARGDELETPNGGNIRQALGLICLVVSAAFGVLGSSLLPAAKSRQPAQLAERPAAERPKSLSGSRCSRCCTACWVPPPKSIFAWLHPCAPSAFGKELPLSLLLEAIGLFWFGTSVVIVMYSLIWLEPAFRTQSARERQWDETLYGAAPSQFLFVLFPWVLHVAETIGLSRDAKEGKEAQSVLMRMGCCGGGFSVYDSAWWCVATHWSVPSAVTVVYRALRHGLKDSAVMDGRSQASDIEGVLLLIFASIFVAFILFRAITFESSMLTSALSKLAGLTYLAGTALSLVGLIALPRDEGYSALMFISGTYYGYFVPIHLWVLVLQTQKAQNNAMGMFVRYLSHEIRVPANVSLLALGEAQAAIRSEIRKRRRAGAHTEHVKHMVVDTATVSAKAGALVSLPQHSPTSLSSQAACEMHNDRPTASKHHVSLGASPVRLPPVMDSSTDPREAPQTTLTGEGRGRGDSDSPTGREATTEHDTDCVLSSGKQIPGHQFEHTTAGHPNAQRMPLVPISGKGAVRDTADSDERLRTAEENTSDALMALQGMKQLLDRTLDLARFESGMQVLDAQVFDVVAFLSALHRESLLGFKAANVELKWRHGGLLAGLALAVAPVEHGDNTADAVMPATTADAVDGGGGGETMESRAVMMGTQESTPMQQRTQSHVSLASPGVQASERPSSQRLVGAGVFGSTCSAHSDGGGDGAMEVHAHAQSGGSGRWRALWVRGDPLRLRQSIMNILHNASKYTPAGQHVYVTAALHPSSSAMPTSGRSSASQRGSVCSYRGVSWLGGCCLAPPVRPASASRSGGGGIGPVPVTSGGASDVSAPLSRAPASDATSLQMASPAMNSTVDERFMLVVEVRDTGRGMTPAEQRGIFTPFSRLHSAQEGTGLGLNIARMAMRTHGGDVRVHSEGLGTGCTFTVSAAVSGAHKPSSQPLYGRLHTDTVSDTTSSGQPSMRHATSSGVSSGGGGGGSGGADGGGQLQPELCILVVDDDSATRKVMSRVLRRQCPRGTHILTAADGQAAVQLVTRALAAQSQSQQQQAAVWSEGQSSSSAAAAVPMLPTHVTMDNQMPVMTGVAATAALRAAGFMGRIVGVSGNATRVGNDEDGFLAAGADGVVSKPATYEKLREGLQLPNV